MNLSHLKVRQHVAGQLLRALAVNDGRSVRVGQRPAIAALRRGGQTQPVGRQRKFGDAR
jgi:hypothetical protein